MTDNQLICELAKSGMPAYQIARKFEITPAQVYEIVSSTGGYIDARGGRTKAIRALILKGLTTDEIIQKVDACRIFVNQVRYKMGAARPRTMPDSTIEQRYVMAAHLVQADMVISEACKSVQLSTRDYYEHKKALPR